MGTAIERIASEKSKSKNETKRRLSEAAMAIILAGYGYASLGSSFRFDTDRSLRRRVDEEISKLKASFLSILTIKSMSASIISSEENEAKYGLKYSMTEKDVARFLGEDIDGENAEDRIDRYLGGFRTEMETYCIAGIMLGLRYKDVSYAFVSSISSPYSSKLIIDAAMKGFIDVGNMKFGKGNYAASFSNMTRLEYDTIQKAYVRSTLSAFGMSAKINGYRGYRNSSTPCEICDAHKGKFYRLDNMIYPLHGRCICGVEPVSVDGKEFSKDV